MNRSLLAVLLLACGVGPAPPVLSGTQDDVPVRPTTWGRLKRHWVADPAGSR